MTCERCVQLNAEVRLVREMLRQLQETNDRLRARTSIENDAPAERPVSIEGAQIREVFDTWAEVCKHPRAKLTADRRSKVKARLRDGYTTEDLKLAVRGAARAAYVDARGHKWDDLTLILRSGANVERFMALAGPDADELRDRFIA